MLGIGTLASRQIKNRLHKKIESTDGITLQELALIILEPSHLQSLQTVTLCHALKLEQRFPLGTFAFNKKAHLKVELKIY